jgi:hypothetical protein
MILDNSVAIDTEEPALHGSCRQSAMGQLAAYFNKEYMYTSAATAAFLLRGLTSAS